MKGYLLNKTKSQSGFAHLAIIVVLTVLLLGTLGFVFYQNFIQNKDNTSKDDGNKSIKKSSDDVDDTTTPDTVDEAMPAVAPATVVDDFVASYFSYITAENSAQEGHSDVAFANQSSALTTAFKDNLNSLMVATADHFLLIQNTPSGFTVGDATTAGSSSSVPVTVKVGSSQTNIVYKLVLVENEWKINDVVRV